ncbi:unnamed protein product [Rotaria sordida]|uniref:Uncharacterized protein n=1 Tax=Rotaria sordida TaxID=392033 RepID=A0A815END9_9BILA|nr:unnamed protein product [Rotaria sordida]
MQNNHIVFILVLIFIFYDQSIQLCQKFSNHLIISTINKTIPISKRCYTIGQCHLTVTTSDYHHHIKLKQNNDSSQLFFSSKFKLLINYDSHNTQMLFSSISTNGIINTTNISTKNCYIGKEFVKRNTRQYNRSGSTSSIIITFNSSSFIDYRHKTILNYPLRLSVRFRTLGRISNGVLFSLIYGKSISSIIPFIIIEHTNGKIEITILRLDERNVLSNVTSIQCGKNVNNDNWHKLYFEIDLNGIFKIVVDDDIRTSQIPTYVVSSWNINALLVGDTRRLNTDIFQPFIGYMSDLIFNDEYLFKNLITRKQDIQSLFHIYSQHIIVGYRIAFFNLITIETQTSHIAFSERESQNKNHGKLDIYFLFRSYVPDGIILYRYAQGLNEYFAIGLRAGILTLFMDFGFGKRQIVSDESTKLADGKWHEVRVTRIGTDKIELVVDNRVNRSTLSANGIRNAVSLQPVLYIGGIPNNNLINLTDSGLNSYGFQGCLSSFIVDGRLLDYQTALALHGKVNMNVCSDITSNENNDLNKLCYDFTCIHSGICITNDNDGPKCDCMETAYIGERCDKLPNGFYFGKRNLIGSLEYVMAQTRQTEHDIITFGLQTYSISAQIFRLESDLNLYSLEYEIVRGRSYIKLNLGEKQSDIYSAITHITDGIYHAIKIIRKFSIIELYVDGIRIKLEGGNKYLNQLESKSFLAQRRLRIGNFKNISQWNGIIAGLAFNRQSIFDSLNYKLIRLGDIEEVYPDQYTGQFNLTSISSIETSIHSTSTSTISIINITIETSSIPILGHLYHNESITKLNIISPEPIHNRGIFFHWLFNQIKYFPIRTLLISLLIISCFIFFLLFIIIRLHCTNYSIKRKNHSYKHHHETNGKIYSQLYQQNKRYSLVPHNNHESKKCVPKFLRHLHTNESKSTSFRLSTNSCDNYHLISSLKDKDNKSLPYRNSDCILNEHCCIHSSLSQPISSSSSSIYHQINRLILSGSDPPLPLAHVTAQSHSQPISTATLRSLKKEIDNSSAQTYSAVYSCDLVANLDIDQDIVQKRSSIKRRSILKNTHSSIIQTKLLFLYVKNLVDCYALQPNNITNKEPIVLATADENRIQLFHAVTGSFHSRLPVSSVGSCHNLLFSYNGQYLIGLFYEITSNLNPYAIKIWSTNDYTIHKNLHPIKCSIALTSQHSSVLYMAGKQKYGRGISLGLLDIDTCNLIRELKSDPDTSIGDEIRRIILTKNEIYALIVCTEHTSTYTCFVIYKLDTSTNLNNEQTSLISHTMNNCTMILTRFDSDPNNTFEINDTNNNDQYMLTILRTNEILIWKLNDGEILFNYNFHHLNSNNNIQQILSCQMNDNRLLIHIEQGLIHIWDITFMTGQFSLIATISDPLIHSISWLDQRHFLSIDNDGKRIRIWNIYRKEILNELISSQNTLQSLYVHLLTNDSNKRQEYLIIGKSINERDLLIFEYTQPYDDQIDSSNIPIC